ncbi:EamA family transporter, partial [Streptomyces sp. SID89]|nr:EamA family transporter [Streptomyces sp. SID89]
LRWCAAVLLVGGVALTTLTPGRRTGRTGDGDGAPAGDTAEDRNGTRTAPGRTLTEA